MTAARLIVEDAADESAARIARWEAMHLRWERDLAMLTEDDRQTPTELGDAMNALQDAAAKLFMAAVSEQAAMPDVEQAYRTGQRPCSY